MNLKLKDLLHDGENVGDDDGRNGEKFCQQSGSVNQKEIGSNKYLDNSSRNIVGIDNFFHSRTGGTNVSSSISPGRSTFYPRSPVTKVNPARNLVSYRDRNNRKS